MKATEQYFPVVLFNYAVQGGSNFWVCGWNPKVWPFKWKILSSIIRWYWLLHCTKVALTFESVGEILQCDHSNESLLISSFLQYCLLCIIWFISKSIRFFSFYAIFILYSGQPLHICNMQLSWKASWTNRNDGTSRLHCGLLWGNQWYVIKIHIETLQTALHTFLLRIVERIWFEIKVFSLWSSFSNSHNLYSCWSADVVRRKLMLVTLGPKGLMEKGETFKYMGGQGSIYGIWGVEASPPPNAYRPPRYIVIITVYK